MRFDTGEYLFYATNSNATTASFTLTQSTQHNLIQKIDVCAYGASDAIVTVQGSGTTLWQMRCGSAAVPASFDGLSIDGGGYNTLSCNVTASVAGSYIAICGMTRRI